MTEHDKNEQSKDFNNRLVDAKRNLDLLRKKAYSLADRLDNEGLNEISNKVRIYADKNPSIDDFNPNCSWVNYTTPKDDLALNQSSFRDRDELLKLMEDIETARQIVHNIEFAAAQRSNYGSQLDGGYQTTIPNE